MARPTEETRTEDDFRQACLSVIKNRKTNNPQKANSLLNLHIAFRDGDRLKRRRDDLLHPTDASRDRVGGTGGGEANSVLQAMQLINQMQGFIPNKNGNSCCGLLCGCIGKCCVVTAMVVFSACVMLVFGWIFTRFVAP